MWIGDKEPQKQENENETSLAKAFHIVGFVHQNNYHEENGVYGTFQMYVYGLYF